MGNTSIRAGLRSFDVDGKSYDVVGNINYSLGKKRREELTGADRHHGFKETPGVAFMELEIRDGPDVDVEELTTYENVTCAAYLANGKTVFLRGASHAGEATQGSEEGTIAVRFVGASGEEVTA